jgi:V/A-type H+-transporting ATPase subunit I
MLKPLTMQRIALQVLQEDAPLAALVLAVCGVFNPETTRVFAQDLPEFPGEHYRELYHSARSRLDKVLAHCALREEEVAVPPMHQIRENELAELNDWLGGVWLECSRCQEGLRQVEEEQKRIDQLMKTLDNFASLDIDLGLLAKSKRFLDVHVGTVPSVNVARLREAVGLAGYLLAPFLHADDQTHVVIAGPIGHEDDIRPVLQAAGWHAVHVPPELRDQPDKVRQELRARADRVVDQTAAQCRLIERTQQEFHDKLVAAVQSLALAAPYAELGEALRGRGGLSLIGGWIPKTDLPRVRAALHARLDDRFVLSARDPLPSERREVPSVIRHVAWMRPFAELVKNYGVPRYGEIDPTVLFAVTYVAMFGMMFGDIGHGSVIALSGWLLSRRIRPFGPFVIAAGLASMAFGWLYGSVFGFEEFVRPLWIAPLSDPIRMLTVALYWGIGFILLATVLTIYNRLVEHRYADALLDGKGLAGLLFYVGICYGAYRGVHDGVFGLAEWATMLVPFSVVLGYKWHEYHGQLGERVLVVLIEGFETILSYLANTLSFLRVAAFSLNHVALAIAVFTLANMMQGTGHWIAVVLGNVFILVLEGAIVAIQALRLEYYEGFSRFFSGDGREFRPVRLVLQPANRS